MGIGLGIFLMALGAILSFGVSDRIAGVNLGVIGFILMGAALLSLIMALVMQSQRNKSEHVAIVEHRETGLPRDPRDPRV